MHDFQGFRVYGFRGRGSGMGCLGFRGLVEESCLSHASNLHVGGIRLSGRSERSGTETANLIAIHLV